LRRALHANAQIHRVGFSRIAGRLSAHLLRGTVERRRERLAGFAARAERALRNFVTARRARAERGGRLLAAYSYRGVLARGFALVRDAAGAPLRTAAAVSAGMAIDIEFADGRVGAHADGAASADKAGGDAAKPRGRRGSGSGQGDLF
jgi:exodeoxyribonuclease VII large subunit